MPKPILPSGSDFFAWQREVNRRLAVLDRGTRLGHAAVRDGRVTILANGGQVRAELGLLDDARVAQVFYDVNGDELLRLGEQADGSYGLAVYNGAVYTDLVDYIFGETTEFIASAETTTSTSYVDLATAGPSATVTVGPSGRVRLLAGVEASTEVLNATGNHGAQFGYAASGANTIGDTYLGLHDAWSQVSGVGVANLSRASIASGRVISGLAAGVTTFKLRYAARTQGTAGFANRWIIAQPL